MAAIDDYRKARDLKELDWKPYYPNNMVDNNVEGYYAIINTDSGARKYTITFQYPEVENVPGCVTKKNGPELYILFEKTYGKHVKNYPRPLKGGSWSQMEKGMRDINDFGDFVRAFTSLEKAKAWAVLQYKAIYMYAMSYILTDEEREILIKEQEEMKKENKKD